MEQQYNCETICPFGFIQCSKPLQKWKYVSWKSQLVEQYSNVSFETGNMTDIPIKSLEEREWIWIKLDSDFLTTGIDPMFHNATDSVSSSCTFIKTRWVKAYGISQEN